MTLDENAIRGLLPHRPPILLPREVEIHTPGELGVGRVRLDLDTRLWGERRARELFRELVLEGAAQVLGVVLAGARAGEPPGTGDEQHLLLGFSGVEFAPEAVPEPALEIEVTLVQRLGAICRGRFLARHAGGEIARGELTVMQG
jgi:hypothetical protein